MSVKVGDKQDIAAQIVHLTAQYENTLEKIKISLAAIKNFDPEQIFTHLSQARSINQGSLMPKHIADLCKRCQT